jgi:hypothetical protein
MKSFTSLRGKMVYKPGTNFRIDFATLCVSGVLVNAYKALQLAAKLEYIHYNSVSSTMRYRKNTYYS